MSESDGGVVQHRLWPEPDQLHSYLDQWANYAVEIENRLNAESASHKVTRATFSTEVAQLKQRLETVVIPYQERINNLEQQIEALTVRSEFLEKDVSEAVSRLARMLETSPNVKGITLQGLIGQAILFLDEAKRQFRESL